MKTHDSTQKHPNFSSVPFETFQLTKHLDIQSDGRMDFFSALKPATAPQYCTWKVHFMVTLPTGGGRSIAGASLRYETGD